MESVAAVAISGAVSAAVEESGQDSVHDLNVQVWGQQIEAPVRFSKIKRRFCKTLLAAFLCAPADISTRVSVH